MEFVHAISLTPTKYFIILKTFENEFFFCYSNILMTDFEILIRSK